ncbi:MAG: D-2-hydroxyacid dehydrogenase [Chloroflexota bacterium]
MPKLVMMPPLDELKRSFAQRVPVDLPGYRVVLAETEEDAIRELADAEAAYGWIPPHVLPRAYGLQWLQNPDAGPVAGYFYPALVDHPVVVANPRGIYNDHISQHIMMFVLALAQGLPFWVDAQRARRWDKDARPGLALDLTTATALIFGVGGIGQETARRCQAFGMQVIGVDPRWEHEAPGVERHGPDELDALLPRADVVIATTPHTPETEGVWNAARFKAMKRSAFFINIGRGKTMKMADLESALASGEIAGAGLDVFEVEPLPAESPLWTMPNVLITPHVAVKDAENLPERRYQILLENARRFAAGLSLRNVVDKAGWY